MFLIVAYDVDVSRVNKVKALFREYLFWVQNSVFEGELTEAKFLELKNRLKSIINEETDSVVFYIMNSKKMVEREIIGRKKGLTELDVI